MSSCEWPPHPFRPVTARFRVHTAEFTGGTFELTIPRGATWTQGGPATLSFEGMQTFVGEAELRDGGAVFKVERSLPEHPMLRDAREVLKPSDNVRSQLMARLEEEVRRRGQAIPSIQQDEPVLTRLGNIRQARIYGDIPVTGVNTVRAEANAKL